MSGINGGNSTRGAAWNGRASASGRFVVSPREDVAAARARVATDLLRGVETDPRVIALAEKRAN